MKNQTYGFQFSGNHQQSHVGLYAIGHERQTSTNYCWDSRNRVEENCLVFQYTLKGKGAIRLGDETYDLVENQAFWICLPGDHCYYLPDQSEQWQFIFITLYGDMAHDLFQTITEKHNHVYTFLEQPSFVSIIFNLLDQVKLNQIRNSYQASAYAYQFLMNLAETLEIKNQNNKSYPKSIENVMIFIKENYAQDLSIDQCVEQSGLSKYYFMREFKKYVGVTPLQFLTNIRIKKAIDYLLTTTYSIEQIARYTGYKNGNYFSKVFKNYTGTTPNRYRNTRKQMPVDQWFTDL